MIGRDIGAGRALRVSAVYVPDSIRMGQELIERIAGNCQRQEDEAEGNDASGFLPMQVVDNGKEKKRINQHPNQFLAGNIFNVGCEIAGQCIRNKSNHGPTNRRPKEARLGTPPQARAPKQQNDGGETLDDEKWNGVNRAERERTKHQHPKNAAEQGPFTGTVERVVIHPAALNSGGTRGGR